MTLAEQNAHDTSKEMAKLTDFVKLGNEHLMDLMSLILDLLERSKKVSDANNAIHNIILQTNYLDMPSNDSRNLSSEKLKTLTVECENQSKQIAKEIANLQASVRSVDFLSQNTANLFDKIEITINLVKEMSRLSQQSLENQTKESKHLLRALEIMDESSWRI